MRNIEILNLYTNLTKFGTCTSLYPTTVSAVTTKNLRVLKPYVEDYLNLRNSIVNQHEQELKPDEDDRNQKLLKLCEKEIAELNNVDFAEVESNLTKIDYNVLPKDMPPKEFTLLAEIINI